MHTLLWAMNPRVLTFPGLKEKRFKFVVANVETHKISLQTQIEASLFALNCQMMPSDCRILLFFLCHYINFIDLIIGAICRKK